MFTISGGVGFNPFKPPYLFTTPGSLAYSLIGDLFKASRVDYFEVLMTQRDALESKLELVEAKKQQFNAATNVYRALGGGWN